MKTLDDVRQKAKLTANQKIGLAYFDDLDERMSRTEVAEIEHVVSIAFDPFGCLMVKSGVPLPTLTRCHR